MGHHATRSSRVVRPAGSEHAGNTHQHSVPKLQNKCWRTTSYTNILLTNLGTGISGQCNPSWLTNCPVGSGEFRSGCYWDRKRIYSYCSYYRNMITGGDRTGFQMYIVENSRISESYVRGGWRIMLEECWKMGTNETKFPLGHKKVNSRTHRVLPSIAKVTWFGFISPKKLTGLDTLSR